RRRYRLEEAVEDQAVRHGDLERARRARHAGRDPVDRLFAERRLAGGRMLGQDGAGVCAQRAGQEVRAWRWPPYGATAATAMTHIAISPFLKGLFSYPMALGRGGNPACCCRWPPDTWPGLPPDIPSPCCSSSRLGSLGPVRPQTNRHTIATRCRACRTDRARSVDRIPLYWRGPGGDASEHPPPGHPR